ncbi:flagellar hook-associated protein FlgK [Phenylobacterium sp.]|uniref:flagellar hook-associated protein FlgK n=1 Tax=Phenylobacterium sp. TaxID=1871053 RepID=UPI002737054E|nr:flagellar hook-associated protein FlgK [Phenylobacterium sp.]MDP3659050.1 flagellar hook-associated protein FlgK [Phenylobacterium sp.]
MSLSVALKTANSGLLAAQVGLRTVSDNIANVNTPGYVRKTVNQQPLAVAGQGMGVKIEGVKRITDQYLQLASLTAGSDASRWGVVSQYLDNAQSLFGDPSSDSFFFSRLDDVWSAFASAADDPSSSLVRSQAIFNMQDFLSDADRINGQIEDLGANLDTQIQADVGRANDLLGQIDKLNQDISRATLVGGDASGSQNIQSQLIDELSTLLNVKVMERPDGGVTIRSTEGVVLAGEGAATLTYNRSDGSKGYITAAPALGVAQAIQVNSGEIRGLLDLRDDKLPGLSSQLGEFVSRAVDRINAVHNASASLPAPTSMTGRNTGLDSATAASGFTGSSTVAIVNANGVMQRRVTVDFAASTISIDGAAATPFVGNPITALNTALGAFGTATFANGALSIAAAGGNGVAIDEGTSAKAGRGFSAFFGLNDVIRSTGFTNYDTGLKSTDAHGFTPGGLITFQMAQADGKPLAQVQVAMPAAANMSDLLTSLNSTSSGVGLYGQFNLDANGALAFTATQPANASLSVIADATQRGVGGPGLSQLFGLSSIDRASRASRYTMDAAISADPMKLALGKLDTTAGTTPALRPGDGTGALAMAGAGDTPTGFSAAGTMGAVTMTVSRYAQEFGGSIGREAAAADTRMTSAQSVQTEAIARRQSVEGVNLDEELVMLTTYQQAFNASARMIQAAKDMFDVLTAMI